jgi:hypothetical protein
MTTAVEWLVEKFMTENTTKEGWHEIFEQAKAMEKEQIVEAYNKSFLLRDKPYATAEKYYNETFKTNK